MPWLCLNDMKVIIYVARDYVWKGRVLFEKKLYKKSNAKMVIG